MSAPVLNGSVIGITRIFNAPRELVWKAWTDPEHISNWWGPRGFTTTTSEFDLRPKGVWRFVMHGPDGTDFLNKVVFKEVNEPEKLAYEHSGDGDTNGIRFTVVVNFEDAGDKTRLDMRMDFETVEQLEYVAKFGAVEGLSDTMDRFTEHLESVIARGGQP
jgi:uncharacterized protein YndB with AHSA1/START domain